MTDEQIDKIYELLQKIDRKTGKIDTIEDRVDDMAEKIDRIYTILDKQGMLLDTDEIERMALGKQVSRHDDWIVRAADKTGMRYSQAG